MLIWVVHLDGYLGANIWRIARLRFCARFLLKLIILQCRKPTWDVKWTKIVIFRYTVCKSQYLRYDHFGGTFGWPLWSQQSVNRPCSFLRLVLAETVNFAMWKADVRSQLDQNLNISLYRAQIWTCMMAMLVVHLDGQLGTNNLWIARFGFCAWSLLKFVMLQMWKPMWEANLTKIAIFRYGRVCRQHGKSVQCKSEYFAIACVNLDFNDIAHCGGAFERLNPNWTR